MLLGGQGSYLKATDVRDDTYVTFKNEGEWITSAKYTYPDGNPKQDFVIKVKIGDEEKSMRLNKTNREMLIQAFGNETSDWVGRSVKLNKVNALISGKMMEVIVIGIGESKDETKDETNDVDQTNDIPF